MFGREPDQRSPPYRKDTPMKSQPQNTPDDSFGKLQKRVYLRMKEDQIEDKVFEVVKGAFEQSLKSENIVLSRMEKHHFLRLILRSVLTDILDRI